MSKFQPNGTTNSYYFLDWRPVACVPLENHVVNIEFDFDPLIYEWGGLFDRLECFSRLDGIFIFKISFKSNVSLGNILLIGRQVSDAIKVRLKHFHNFHPGSEKPFLKRGEGKAKLFLKQAVTWIKDKFPYPNTSGIPIMKRGPILLEEADSLQDIGDLLENDEKLSSIMENSKLRKSPENNGRKIERKACLQLRKKYASVYDDIIGGIEKKAEKKLYKFAYLILFLLWLLFSFGLHKFTSHSAIKSIFYSFTIAAFFSLFYLYIDAVRKIPRISSLSKAIGFMSITSVYADIVGIIYGRIGHGSYQNAIKSLEARKDYEQKGLVENRSKTITILTTVSAILAFAAVIYSQSPQK